MNNKIVLITGTNSGFGWLTAKTVASFGHKVYATMRETNGKNAEKAKELAQVKNITVLDVTLTDDANVANAIDRIIAQEGTIDVLVNNAGAAMFGVVESATPADVQRILDINYIAPWRVTKLVLPAMRKQSDGLIINVTSASGRFSFPFTAVYGASKYALEGLSEGLHYELRPLGIDVAIVQPGTFPTEMSQKIQSGSDASINNAYEVLTDVQKNFFGAVGQIRERVNPNPQDVADAIVQLMTAPKGQRPLRTVVDPTTGEFVKIANDAIHVEYEKTLTAYGMQDLLK